MTSLAQIKQWSNRFNFNEGELEIILRCHSSLSSKTTNSTFLSILAHSVPYVFFFLPQDELEARTVLIEKYILPRNFGEKFKSIIYPCKEKDNEESQIECLIDGIANCCRRKPEDALGVLFGCSSNEEGTAEASKLINLCYSLSVATNVMIAKRSEEKRAKTFLEDFPPLHGLINSLTKKSGKTEVTRDDFISWGTETVPFIYSTLRTFTHILLFHGKKSTKTSHEEPSEYIQPKLLDSSDIFDEDPSLSFTICCMAPNMGGKWKRLFTTEVEETPANCLEAAIDYHSGPSFFVLKTSSGATFGGCVESKWKVCYFLFQVEPNASIYNAKDGRYYINHKEEYETESGEMKGYGIYEDDDDATKWSSSHIFFSIPSKVCVASFMQPGLDTITFFEIWGFGDVLYD